MDTIYYNTIDYKLKPNEIAIADLVPFGPLPPWFIFHNSQFFTWKAMWVLGLEFS